MPPEENKAIVRRYVAEVWDNHNLDVVDELFAPEYIDHVAIHTNITGREGLKRNLIGFLEAFPDARVTIDDLIAEGDRVVWRWTLRGRHAGEFRGIPPTGREITWTGIIIWRILEGHIVEWWANNDALGMMQQLGAIAQGVPGATEREEKKEEDANG